MRYIQKLNDIEVIAWLIKISKMKAMALDEAARYRSFMAKTHLMQTDDHQQTEIQIPKVKEKKIESKQRVKHSPLPNLKFCKSQNDGLLHIPKLPRKSDKQPIPTPASIIPVKLTEYLSALSTKAKPFSPVLPKKHKVTLFKRESTRHLPSLTNIKQHLPSLTNIKTSLVRQSSYHNIKDKLRKKSNSYAVSPTSLKYQSSAQQLNVSQLNRVVSREVYYKLNKIRKNSDT